MTTHKDRPQDEALPVDEIVADLCSNHILRFSQREAVRRLVAQRDTLSAQLSEAQARLAEIERQEPIGWRPVFDFATDVTLGDPTPETVEYWKEQGVQIQRVYAAPVQPAAAQVPDATGELWAAVHAKINEESRWCCCGDCPPKAAPVQPAAVAVPDEDIEALAACLEDDANILRNHEEGWEEIARNMDDAAALLRLSAPATPAAEVPQEVAARLRHQAITQNDGGGAKGWCRVNYGDLLALLSATAQPAKVEDDVARDAAVGAAVERAARDLPFGYDIRIEIENGAGTVSLYGPDCEEIRLDFDGDTFAGEINTAIDTARTIHQHDADADAMPPAPRMENGYE